jgi:hypothetical protein
MRVICIINSWGYASYFMHFLCAYITSIIILASWCMHHLVSIMMIALSHMHHFGHAWNPPSSCCIIIANIHSTVYYIHDYIPSIAFWVGAFCHYFLIALVQIGMFYNQHHPNYSGNKLWARMFQTSLINLSNYPHLLSMSFVMILALWEFDHLFLSYLVKLIYVQSLHALVILISSCSCHQPQSSLVWLLFATFDV